ncbi:helix-turn-helix domain-containing protein [Psychromonas sp. KJ10-10]|uniref:helix-turn-helix domain-containing protein n=1 Tax=Psychromonas sp. KJ10-10 TaxID=3391823 RepID=UPI0039B5112D
MTISHPTDSELIKVATTTMPEQDSEQQTMQDVYPSMTISQSKEEKIAPIKLGERLKEIRKTLGLTLEEASQKTGLARSTLSKIENEQISPTYQAMQKLTMGLQIDIPQLFATSKQMAATGRRDITRVDEGRSHPTSTYEHELLATQLTNKKMMPFKSLVRARSFDDYSDWIRHDGEEFLLVLEGEITFFSEFYEPVNLNQGDSVYYDANMGHMLVSASEPRCFDPMGHCLVNLNILLEYLPMSEQLLVTPLHALHVEMGAKMVPFAGYDMPVQYKLGVKKEHLHCRACSSVYLMFLIWGNYD